MKPAENWARERFDQNHDSWRDNLRWVEEIQADAAKAAVLVVMHNIMEPVTDGLLCRGCTTKMVASTVAAAITLSGDKNALAP